MNSHVLVMDDDLALAEMIGIVLGSEGFDVATCSDGVQALDVFHQENPDLILLDIIFPGMDGIEICTRIRKESDVSIVMLIARADTADVIAGLEAGADGYVPRPFKHKELVARVRARLRGREEVVDERLVLGDPVIDVSGYTAHRGGEGILLILLEFDLLVALGHAPWRAFSREELFGKVWGYRHAADTRLVNIHVQRLRSKIERNPDKPEVVITVRGVGYRAETGAWTICRPSRPSRIGGLLCENTILGRCTPPDPGRR